MKKQYIKNIHWVVFATVLLLFFSCTNYKNAKMYEVGEYIEKHFGSQSAEYKEYDSLEYEMSESLRRCGLQVQNYGNKSREYYLALQDLVQKQQAMLKYFDRIGARKSAEYLLSEIIQGYQEEIKNLAPICEYGTCDMCGTQCVEGHYYYTDGKYYYDSPHRCGRCHRKKEVQYFIDVLEGRKH